MILLCWIVIFPPPLLTSDVDNHFGVFGLGKFENSAESKDANNSKDERRDDCENDFNNWLAMTLRRNRLSAISELPKRVGSESKNENSNNTGHRENNPLKVVNNLGVIAFRLPRILRRIGGATSKCNYTEDRCN